MQFVRPIRFKPRTALAIATAGITLVAVGIGRADVPGVAPTAPSVTQTKRTTQEIAKDYINTTLEMNRLASPKVLSDEKQRTEDAPKIIPVAHRQLGFVEELVAAKAVPQNEVDPLRWHSLAVLYLLKDAGTIAQIQQDRVNNDKRRQLSAQCVELLSRWLGAASEDECSKVADELEKLDRAQPSEEALSHLTVAMSQTSRSRPMNHRMLTLITDVMTDPYSKQIATQIRAQKKHQEEIAAIQDAILNKPYVIQGKTVQGADFSSDSLKGKVVMIDFWATWCGPCKAELPHVIETYNKYHDQGLEIVGVSNDYDAKALLDFTPKNHMPWTQLFDADAASKRQWNPLSEKNGVEGIPCLFLIDRKGVLRSVTAREEMDSLIPKLLGE